MAVINHYAFRKKKLNISWNNENYDEFTETLQISNIQKNQCIDNMYGQ